MLKDHFLYFIYLISTEMSEVIVCLEPMTMIILSNLLSFVDNMILEIMMMLNILLTNAWERLERKRRKEKLHENVQ